MPNMQRIISAHNSKILREEEQRKKQQQSQEQNQQPVKRRGRKKKQPPVDGPGCGCQAGVQACPMGGQCKVESIVYRAKVTEENGHIETYTGLTSNTFKKRYYKHDSDFKDRESKGTTLSTHIWKLKDENKNFNINWEVVAKAPPFNPSNKKCRLCLTEKYHITFTPEGATLNSRNEMFATCRHRKKLLVDNIK